VGEADLMAAGSVAMVHEAPGPNDHGAHDHGTRDHGAPARGGHDPSHAGHDDDHGLGGHDTHGPADDVWVLLPVLVGLVIGLVVALVVGLASGASPL
jgi:hypothetical protein